MKLLSVLDQLATIPAAPEAAPRRALLRQLGHAAVAALPLGLGAALPAAAGTKDSPYDAIAQLLLLERLQAALYTRALAAPGLVPAAQAADFQRMLRHQTQHAAFLAAALENAGAVVPAAPVFDFSGRHGVATNPELFPSVLTDYDAFLALAQQLEDLGVRLYKGQAFAISTDSQLSNSALRIHAVEARHSAHVRGLRRGRGAAVSNWPSENDAPIGRPAAAQALTVAATGGEDSALQYASSSVRVPFISLLFGSNLGVRPLALAEAFDEPIGNAVAQAALDLFV